MDASCVIMACSLFGGHSGSAGPVCRQQHAQDLEQSRRVWPVSPDDYELLEECGRGGCSVVHHALCKPFGEEVAIKRSNLEGVASSLAAITKEATLMHRFRHANVLPLHASFVAGHELWMVMPFLGAGSVRDIMRRHFPQGLSEAVIATIARDVLRALAYMHKNGGIHRDVKAANILIREDGGVTLADLGVAAVTQRPASAVNLAVSMHNTMRSTFVGTPCWMAPEVLEQASGYDASADVWSFGITLLELATGRPPLARLHPMRVVMTTIQAPPPTLAGALAAAEAGGGGALGGALGGGGGGQGHGGGGGGGGSAAKRREYSKHMHELVGLCLQKDPTERPGAAELLQHKFFKQARDKDYLRRCFMHGPSSASSTPPQSPRAAHAAAASSPGGRPAPGSPRMPQPPHVQLRQGAPVLLVPVPDFGAPPQRQFSAWIFDPQLELEMRNAASAPSSPRRAAAAGCHRLGSGAPTAGPGPGPLGGGSGADGQEQRGGGGAGGKQHVRHRRRSEELPRQLLGHLMGLGRHQHHRHEHRMQSPEPASEGGSMAAPSSDGRSHTPASSSDGGIASLARHALERLGLAPPPRPASQQGSGSSNASQCGESSRSGAAGGSRPSSAEPLPSSLAPDGKRAAPSAPRAVASSRVTETGARDGSCTEPQQQRCQAGMLQVLSMAAGIFAAPAERGASVAKQPTAAGGQCGAGALSPRRAVGVMHGWASMLASERRK